MLSSLTFSPDMSSNSYLILGGGKKWSALVLSCFLNTICLIFISSIFLVQQALVLNTRDDFGILFLECRRFLSNSWFLWLKSMDFKTPFYLFVCLPCFLKGKDSPKIQSWSRTMTDFFFPPHLCQSFSCRQCVEKAVTDPKCWGRNT